MPDHAPSAGLLLGRFRLPLAERTPKHARDLAVQVATGWGLEDIAWTVRLAVSELVTNALLHTGAARGANVVIEILRVGKRFHVAVHDSSKDSPRLREAGGRDVGELREGGRGLQLLTTATDLCGFHPTPSGKAVWFELAADWPFDVIGRY